MKIYRTLYPQESTPCVLTIGFFDGVHVGHRFLLEQTKQAAFERGVPWGVVSFDTHPRTYFQPDQPMPLLTTEEEKIALLEEVGCDLLFLLPFNKEVSNYSAQEFIQEVLARRFGAIGLLIGYDHRFGHNRTESFEDYVEYGKTCGMDVIQAFRLTSVLHHGEREISSSLVRTLLQAGDMDSVTRYLTRPYFVGGVVVGGFQQGRKLGYPTANIQPSSPDKLIPPRGVYAVWCTLPSGERHKGMLNIGSRPTLQDGADDSIEVHILDFTGDLYDQDIQVHFVARLRAEKQFASLLALRKQLQQDEVDSRRLLNKQSFGAYK